MHDPRVSRGACVIVGVGLPCERLAGSGRRPRRTVKPCAATRVGALELSQAAGCVRPVGPVGSPYPWVPVDPRGVQLYTWTLASAGVRVFCCTPAVVYAATMLHPHCPGRLRRFE